MRISRPFVILVVCSFLSAELNGQESSRFIAVDGTGTVSVKPDRLSFSVSLMKNGETLKKVKLAFDELKATFNTTFNVMKFKGLSLKSTSKSISPQPTFPGGAAMMAPPIAFGGGGGAIPAGPGAAQVYVSETVHFRIDGIDEMTSEEIEKEMMAYVSELKKIGLAPTAGFSTSVQNQKEAPRKAFAKAMANAKEKAESIAELSNGKIGKVISVTQGQNPTAAMYNPYAYTMPGMSPYGQAGVSESVDVSAMLSVKFELTD